MKVKCPLFSTEARGTIAGFLTFSKRRSGQQVRWQKKQSGPASVGQAVQRAEFSKAQCACDYMDYGVAIYGVRLYGNELSLYISAAAAKKITEKNQCISEYL